MSNHPVKWFTNEMQGAPVLGHVAPNDQSAGNLVALLKACLVTGFGHLTVDLLEWDATAGEAVATFNGGHKYPLDSVIAITGASPAAFNGEHRVTHATSNQLRFKPQTIPSGNASGTISCKVAPAGWSVLFESADQKQAIFKAGGDHGDVLLRVDNTAFSGWTHSSYGYHLAKVELVEDATDINTATVTYSHFWPATGRFGNGEWDLVADNGLFYFMPNYTAHKLASAFVAGYLCSVRPADRYHFVLSHLHSSPLTAPQDHYWSSPGSYNMGGDLPQHNQFARRALARSYSQIEGVVSWKTAGLFARIGMGYPLPNPADNGLYLSDSPVPVMEGNGTLRGYLPGVVTPLQYAPGQHRRHLRDLPELPNALLRFVMMTGNINPASGERSVMAFNLAGSWR